MMNQKTKVLTLLLICSTIFSYGQKDYEKYTMSYFDGVGKLDSEYQISVSEQNGKLYIDMYGSDKLRSNGGIIVDTKYREGLRQNLMDSKVKYDEWVKVGKENDVKDMDKKMSKIVSKGIKGFFQYGSEWEFDSSVKLSFTFRITESEDGNVRYLMIVRTGDMVSSTNQYMDVDEFMWVFVNGQEVQELIDLLDDTKIETFLNKKDEVKDLFSE
jgi:hypothetical protein